MALNLEVLYERYHKLCSEHTDIPLELPLADYTEIVWWMGKNLGDLISGANGGVLLFGRELAPYWKNGGI